MPRSDSRQSTPSTVSLPDSLYSWSAQMYPGSSATSQWSEDGETVSPSHESWHKGDLIQLDSDGEGLRGVAHHANESLIDDPESEEDLPTPQDKLRQLLRQMQAEVHVNTEAAASPKRPIPPPRQPEPEPSSRRANWREGRRIGVYPPPSPGSGDDSPPTPPMRVTNPFTRHPRTSRVIQDTSQASTSKSPLEQYITQHPDASSSSRKGKERASPDTTRRPRYSPTEVEATPKHTRHARTSVSATPRRFSVEMAPDDSALFAIEAGELEAGMQLDLDEDVSGRGVVWEQATDSAVSDEDRSLSLPPLPRPEEYEEEESSPRQRRATFRSGSGGRTESPGITPRITERINTPPLSSFKSRSASPDHSRYDSTVNPPIRVGLVVEPQESTHPGSIDTAPFPSLEREARARSPAARSPPVATRSPPVPTRSPLAAARTPPVATKSPPVATRSPTTTHTPAKTQRETLATPHPPGWLANSPAHRSVRFSPLRKTDADWSASPSIESVHTPTRMDNDGGSFTHRIKLSPAQKPRSSPRSMPDPDASFTQRVVAKISTLIPLPSRTYSNASPLLSRAAKDTALAHSRVEASQKAWLDAIGALQRLSDTNNSDVVRAVKKSAGWGVWAWWVVLEVVLLWAVFRVTLEYSTLHSSNIIPPNLHRAMSVPTSSGVSAFLVSRDSANFFDLLERLDGVWAGSRVESWVLGAGAGANSDGGRMRLVGGVPS